MATAPDGSGCIVQQLVDGVQYFCSGGSALRECEELVLQRHGNGHTFDLRLGGERATTLARQANARVREHRGDQVLDAFVVSCPARERVGIDREERLADAWPVAL